MSTQLLHSEVKHDKQALATVLRFLKTQNLTETEETLRRELGSATGRTFPGVLQSSQTQPEQVDVAYNKPLIPSPSKRILSSNIEMTEEEDEVISVDDDESDDDERPCSWPGSYSTVTTVPPPLKSIPFGPVLQPTSVTTPNTNLPLVLKPHSVSAHIPNSMPTLFTIVTPSLVQPNSSIKPFMQNTSSPIMTTTALPVSLPNKQDKPETPVYKPQPQGYPFGNPARPNQLINKSATTLAAISPEDMTPAYLELKEFAETFKTKRIQLGFTQGAVGQSLADRGYSNFAQSTISRFEQMQLSPSNAAAIKVVLERWLQDADNPQAVTSTTQDPLGPPRKRKKRAVFSPQTRETLEDYFFKEARPNRQIIETIANELGLLPEEVRVWFCNKRQKLRIQDDSTEDGNVSIKSLSPPPIGVSPRVKSPPRTKFTIEELSKSSSSTSHTFSPVSFTSAISLSGSPQFQPIILPAAGNTFGAITSPPFVMNNLITKA